MSQDQNDATAPIPPEADASAATPVEPVEAEIAALTVELESARAEALRNKDAYLRALADIENIRRRTQRDIEDSRKFALQRIAEDLLPVLDDLAAGLAAADKATEVKTVVDGMRMVGDRLKAALGKNGFNEISPAGTAFDPHAHESVAHVPHATIPEDHVVDVYRAGYRLHDRVIRPATVTVSSGPAA